MMPGALGWHCIVSARGRPPPHSAPAPLPSLPTRRGARARGGRGGDAGAAQERSAAGGVPGRQGRPLCLCKRATGGARPGGQCPRLHLPLGETLLRECVELPYTLCSVLFCVRCCLPWRRLGRPSAEARARRLAERRAELCVCLRLACPVQVKVDVGEKRAGSVLASITDLPGGVSCVACPYVQTRPAAGPRGALLDAVRWRGGPRALTLHATLRPAALAAGAGGAPPPGARPHHAGRLLRGEMRGRRGASPTCLRLHAIHAPTKGTQGQRTSPHSLPGSRCLCFAAAGGVQPLGLF